MILNTGIKGISAQIKDNVLLIQSEKSMRMLSSAIFNGGLKDVKMLLNIQVPMGSGEDTNDVHWNYEAFIKTEIQKLGLLKDEVVGLMTAANVQNVAVCSEKFDDAILTVFTTAGSTVAVAAGEPAFSESGYKPPTMGTINVALIVDGNLTDGCMVEAVKTLTEAKTVALRELDIRSQFSGDLATGTLTDSVAVGCTKIGKEIQFAGTFTMLGELIGKCVRKTIKQAMYRQDGLESNRFLAERLSERGITPESIALLIEEAGVNLEPKEAEELQKQMKHILSDKKMVPVVISFLRLDDDYAKCLIPKDAEECLSDALFQEIIQNVLRKSLKDQNIDGPFISSQLIKMGPFTKRLFLAVLDYLSR